MKYEISVDSEKAKSCDTMQDLLDIIEIEICLATIRDEPTKEFKIYFES